MRRISEARARCEREGRGEDGGEAARIEEARDGWMGGWMREGGREGARDAGRGERDLRDGGLDVSRKEEVCDVDLGAW